MKKTIYLTSVFIAIAALFANVTTSYGGSKEVSSTTAQDAPPFDQASQAPCTVFDDEDNFAATGFASGAATEKGALQLVALKNAQDVIALKMQHAVEGAVKSFFESVGSNQGTDLDSQTIGGINNIILGIVSNTSHSCLMWSNVDAKGNIECYIAIQVSKVEIANAVADSIPNIKSKDIIKLMNETAGKEAKKQPNLKKNK
jgi:hypothetical protein